MNFSFKKKKGGKYVPTALDKLLDTTLYTLPNGKDKMDIRSAVSGVVNFGQTGSGKSSGMCRQYFQSQLDFGMGGIAIAVKKSFGRYMLALAEKSGREVIHFKKGSSYTFNPLEYELSRQGNKVEVSSISELIVLLSKIVNNHREGGSGGSRASEPYWDNAMHRCLNRIIALLILAKLPVTIFNISRALSSAFTENEAVRYREIKSTLLDENVPIERKEEVYLEYEVWKKNNFFLHAFNTANIRKDLSEDELFMMELVGNYFIREYPILAEKTKSVVVESVMGVIEVFNSSSLLKDHFTEGVSEELLPENSYKKGTIVLCDFPVKEDKLAALVACVTMKYCFQTALERRDIYAEDNPQPAFLFLDEYQNLCTANDIMFQATARESLVATTLITQSFNSIIGAMGGMNARQKAESLVANLSMKIWNANDDFLTNSMASKIIGEHLVDMSSVSIGQDKNARRSYSQQYRYQVPPEHFTSLKTGGTSNKYKVEAILFQAGRQWASGKNYLQETFDQNV